MIKWLVGRNLRAFSNRYDYDTGYMHEVLEVDAGAILKLALARSFLGHAGTLPAAVWHAARLRATLAADCGPCLALAVKMAEEDGMTKNTIAAILKGNVVDPDLQLAIVYADAVVANRPEYLASIQEVRERFGMAGLNGLSIAVVAGMFYPLYKRGLGHATTCLPVLMALEAP
ncbi:carboxymuconolactone decarboxylase family protein [Rhizobium alvei]|uniref:Carboxymuconolactone decarboxylase family protein n=1 Tax=Rhizobium alvei TaxID=1132659 RepID=A0ABT8YH17_9HYPH|nr:carboxymuconolactone decarboxylase family protein [Rhizobium alvei]MDO6962871.1 carboxymuconolactone decarboxylase family protein [Rhizobium alvei]